MIVAAFVARELLSAAGLQRDSAAAGAAVAIIALVSKDARSPGRAEACGEKCRDPSRARSRRGRGERWALAPGMVGPPFGHARRTNPQGPLTKIHSRRSASSGSSFVVYRPGRRNRCWRLYLQLLERVQCSLLLCRPHTCEPPPDLLGPLRCRARGHLRSTRKDKPEEVVLCSRAQRSLRLVQTRQPPQVNFVEARTETNEEF